MNKQLTTFYIARHGRTEWNDKGIMQGHMNSNLTDFGKEQAKNLAKELKDIHFDFAFSSDLIRAKQTAEIVTLEKNLAIQTSELIRERMLGQYEGHTYEAFKAYEDLRDALEGEELRTFKAHGVESIEEVTSRTITFVRETAVLYPGKTILVVSHGDLMYHFLVHLGFATYDTFSINSIGNTAYLVLQTDGVDFFIGETKRIEPPIK